MRSVILSIVLVVPFFGVQAQSRPASDPPAIALAAQSIAAVAGSSNLSDVTLTGNAKLNMQESGTFKLSALGSGESRIDLVLPGGTTTVIRDVRSKAPHGEWKAPNNRSGTLSSHNCLTDAAWFIPALGSLAAAPNVVLTYVGKEVRKGVEVQHLHSYVYEAGQGSVPGMKELSGMDFYLDAATLLPVATTFNAHPDHDALTNLLVEIDFTDYQRMNGVLVPKHIQRYQQGALILDLIVTGASFNSGLQPALFAIN
ncbi:MAG: hypothetical protein CXZ00_05170 [Acidobacteria bacterium]|nr:MAG: hypothetical protein CXZ00_05170 [Acidobacteriota bacterium]